MNHHEREEMEMKYDSEEIMQKLTNAIGYLERARDEMEELDMVMDMKPYLDRLYDLAGDIELELDALEVEFDD